MLGGLPIPASPFGNPPLCTACREAGTRCSPRQVPVEPSEESNGLSHAALPGYTESLTQRIRALEALTSQKRRRVSSDDPDGDATPPMLLEGLDSLVQTALGEIGFLSRALWLSLVKGPAGSRGSSP
jgi:hypothetical protein